MLPLADTKTALRFPCRHGAPAATPPAPHHPPAPTIGCRLGAAAPLLRGVAGGGVATRLGGPQRILFVLGHALRVALHRAAVEAGRAVDAGEAAGAAAVHVLLELGLLDGVAAVVAREPHLHHSPCGVEVRGGTRGWDARGVVGESPGGRQAAAAAVAAACINVHDGGGSLGKAVIWLHSPWCLCPIGKAAGVLLAVWTCTGPPGGLVSVSDGILCTNAMAQSRLGMCPASACERLEVSSCGPSAFPFPFHLLITAAAGTSSRTRSSSLRPPHTADHHAPRTDGSLGPARRPPAAHDRPAVMQGAADQVGRAAAAAPVMAARAARAGGRWWPAVSSLAC